MEMARGLRVWVARGRKWAEVEWWRVERKDKEVIFLGGGCGGDGVLLREEK